MSSIATVEEYFHKAIDVGLLGTGGQIYVSMKGETLVDLGTGVDGLDRPIGPDMLFALYCSGKPAVALAVAVLIDEGELSLDDRIGDVIAEAPRALAPVRVHQVLTHTAGLHWLDPVRYFSLSSNDRAALLSRCVPLSGWQVGRDLGYASVLGWSVLGWIIEALSGQSCREYVRARVIEPMGVDDAFFVCGMSERAYQENADRIGVNVFVDGTGVDPVLSERTRRFRCLPDPSGGTTGTMRGLGRFYEGVARILAGESDLVDPELLRSFTKSRCQGFDHVMNRNCAYGYGFMTRLQTHGFGRLCSPDTVGHSAYGGMTAALLDPRHGLVVAFHLNGRIDAETAISYRRPALVEAIYKVLVADPDLSTDTAHVR